MGKNNVAIMTWYTYRNFGTALQACALYHNVEELGYDPYIIQYRPREGLPAVPANQCAFWAEKVRNKVLYRKEKRYTSCEKDGLFEAFLNDRVKETAPCHTYPELCGLNDSFDAFICGSDQIWSLAAFDDNFFLPFVKNAEKKIAYAPSMGQTAFVSEDKKRQFVELISSFRHLSVREKQSAGLIKSLTGKNAAEVLDPTLLMNAGQWDRYLAEQKTVVPDGKYILCYFLGQAERYMKYVGKLSRYLHLPYYFIPITQAQKDGQYALPGEIGPAEFVSLIRNAAFVCTDSFHAIAFSVIYNRPFCAFRRFKNEDPLSQNIRIINFLEKIKMEEQLVDPAKCGEYDKILRCDFSDANRILEQDRKESLFYLKSSLEAAVSVPQEMPGTKPYQISAHCCGCGACASVCPCNAIDIIWSDQGFQTHRIDETRCIRCGKCRRVCPMAGVSAQPIKESRALYDVISHSEEVKKYSSSGGVGFELAQMAGRNGFTVCGCTYDKEINRAKHILIPPNEMKQLPCLQGSKYIQSITSEVFWTLQNGGDYHPVSFFGTPCQVAAMDRLMRQQGRREETLLVDLICHGVPSVNLWDSHLRGIDRACRTGKHPEVMFRHRTERQTLRKLRAEGNGNIYQKDERKDDFYAVFRRGLCHMDACFECPYREKSAADIRIGDYWGTQFETDREIHSMVIVNTKLGEQFFGQLEVEKRCAVRERPLMEYWKVQHPFNVTKPPVRDALLRELAQKEESLHCLRRKYCSFYDTQEKLQLVKDHIKRLGSR